MSAVLSNALRALRISTPCATRPSQAIRALPLQRVSAPSKTSSTVRTATLIPGRRDFSTTTLRPGNWLEPSVKVAKARRRAQKGRPRVSTGGSTRGTTVVWGDYGLRMRDHHRRISAKQLKLAEDTIRARLRGQKYRLYKRVHCNISVSNHGNEMRMGKGKGSFDYWATRVAVNQVVLELKGLVHEQIVRDAFRLAGNKLPGQWEFVKKGDPPMVGLTKLEGVTLEELKKPWLKAAREATSQPTESTEKSSASSPTP